MKTNYLKQQREKILDFAREEYKLWNIDKQTLQDTYFYNFVNKP